MSPPLLEQAASLVADAEALLLTAGAGMGVDSGLPDFRGDQGFWKAYPPFARLGLRFHQMSTPRWFRDDPTLAWGFFGHRLNLYRGTPPHAGYEILRRWADAKPHPAFVYTSNVDGAFQKGGFREDQICEVHGSIHYLQCTRPCSATLWPTGSLEIEVDLETIRTTSSLPTCPACGALARPNILMFSDDSWVLDRSDLQEQRLRRWLAGVRGKRVVILEFGAGLGVPTVRRLGEHVAREMGARLIRINPREPDVPSGELGITMGALEFLRTVDDLLAR